MQVPIVYVSNYGNISGSAQMRVPKLTRWCLRPCRISNADHLSLCQI